jgi:hypothetical protein
VAAALLVCLLFWAALGFVGWKLGDSKGRPGLGVALALLLGLLGLLIVALLPSAKPRTDQEMWQQRLAGQSWQPPPPTRAPAQWVRCPSCGQTISGAVATCGYCQAAVRPSALLPPPEGTPTGWLRDPSGRYVDRYWDGERWTEWTRNGNDYLTDPPVPSRSA